jgi:hypothetical protein
MIQKQKVIVNHFGKYIHVLFFPKIAVDMCMVHKIKKGRKIIGTRIVLTELPRILK